MQSSQTIDPEELKQLMVLLKDSDSEMLEEFFCMVCKERFDNEIKTALAYPCGHSACPECSSNMISNRQPCPMCRVPLRVASVDEIQKNICISKHIEKVAAKRSLKPKHLACNEHHHERAAYFCKDHRVFVCNKCALEKHWGHNVEMADTLYPWQTLIDAQND